MSVWMGRTTSLDERKSASGAAEVIHILFMQYVLLILIEILNHSCSIADLLEQELLQGADRSKSHIIRVIEGFEIVMFRSKFDSWPQTTNVTVSEDGRGKVTGE